jgi:hypothetical protein
MRSNLSVIGVDAAGDALMVQVCQQRDGDSSRGGQCSARVADGEGLR